MVTESDTAAPTPDTAEPVVEAQPETPSLPEKPTPPSLPETEAPAAPETPAEPTSSAEPDSAPTEPEPPSSPDRSQLSDEELENDPAVKSLLARRTEAYRREQEARVAQERQQHVSSGAALQNVLNEAKRAASAITDSGDVELNEQLIAEELANVAGVYVSSAIQAATNAVFADLPPEIGQFMTAAEVQEYNEANRQGGLQNPVPALRVLQKVRDRWTVEQATPDIEKRLRTEIRKEFEAQSANEETRAAAAARAAQTDATPTPGTTTSPGGFRTQLEIDRAHATDQISSRQLRELKFNGTYDSLPYQ